MILFIKIMERFDESETEGRTLLLEIQNSADVEQAIRILKGEEPLGDIKCLQL